MKAPDRTVRFWKVILRAALCILPLTIGLLCAVVTLPIYLCTKLSDSPTPDPSPKERGA